MNTALQLASLNVNGFKDTQKQRHCFHLIRHLPSTIDLLLLQETHLPQAPQLFRPSPFPSYSFFSATDSGSDGVAIYARRSSFSTTPTFTELIPGRAVAITIQYSESTLHIINLYAPPSPHQQQRHRFFATLQEAIPVQWLQDVFLLAGDFNCVLDADLDRVPSTRHLAGIQTSNSTRSISSSTASTYTTPSDISTHWRANTRAAMSPESTGGTSTTPFYHMRPTWNSIVSPPLPS